MLAALIPMFDGNMEVKAYLVSAQRENSLLDTMHSGSLKFDNATRVEGFDIISAMGIKTLAEDREVYVPVNHVALFSDIESQCGGNPDGKVVLVLDSGVEANEMYINRIIELRQKGFKIAFDGLSLGKLGDYRSVLVIADTIFLNIRKTNIKKAKPLFTRIFPRLALCATKVNTQEQYEGLTAYGAFDLYEGEFFRVPAKAADTQLAPMKVTYLNLLKVVNADDFELIAAADVIEQDPALVISLLAMANRMTLNYGITSVRHAAAMIGQTELKRWINTAVMRELCADKPSEITRLSLLRGRFAENLASLFGMGGMAPELFLLGLFSVLDIMLDLPLARAIEQVNVSKKIIDALIDHKGELYPVYEFMLAYENASWQEVSRLLIVKDLEMDSVYEAYRESLQWYRDLISVSIKEK